MGIQGLHKGLGFATKKTTLRDFAGKVLAVDSSSWLHRSVYSVSENYVEAIERGQVDRQCVQVSANYFISRCRELLNAFGIAKIFLVMDGKRCPLKADTNGERERRRQANLLEARDFRRRGRKDKAEEKYKSCIKIKDEFTMAVMAEVRKLFSNDARVQLVWSPYEADAQLAKLCVDGAAHAVITEDSDVLVYSAASHCAFPVIFKLDRQTGTCDVISMDWLLSYDESKTIPSAKTTTGSALEALLMNLASRQSRRPGFGVRLFVQGCVLAGCDYAPNNLTGVGLVNAFKYVRANAFRNDSVRFAKILEAIPRKNKLNIDADEYELILAKSEAVFYYHIVRHPDQQVKPLCQPRHQEPDKNSPHCFTHHFPSMERFANDWSFLGEIQYSSSAQAIEKAPPIREIVICDTKLKANVDRQSSLPPMFATGRKTIPNPYLKTKVIQQETRKRPRNDIGLSMNKIDPKPERPSDTFFAKFARDATKLESNADPRFVKRSFSPLDKESSHQPSTRWFERMSKSNQSGGEHDCGVPKAPKFDYDDSWSTNAPCEGISIGNDITRLTGERQLTLSDSIVEPPTFFDLTDSNSEPIPIDVEGIDDDDDDEAIFKSEPARVSLDDSVVAPDYDFQLPEPSPKDTDTKLASCDSGHSAMVSTRSKYFAVIDTHLTRGDTTSPTKRLRCDESDEIVESPDDSKQGNIKSSVTRFIGIKPTRLGPSFQRARPQRSRKTASGPLLNAFQKQALQSPSAATIPQGKPWVRSFRPLQKRQSHPKSGTSTVTLKSYFPSVKPNPTNFNQLRYNTNPTDEEFLWGEL